MDVSDIIKRYKHGSISLNFFIHKLTGINPEKLQTCKWGSCQYTTIYAMFEALVILDKNGHDATKVIGWGPLSSLPKPVISEQKIPEISILLQEVPYDRPQTRSFFTLDSSFRHMREVIHNDLWYAVFKAFSMAFNSDLKDFTSRIQKSPGFGPYLNMNAQKENYTTALGCFMLVKYGFIRDPDGSFSGFDT